MLKSELGTVTSVIGYTSSATTAALAIVAAAVVRARAI
jgi:hypothetical protein